MENEIICEQVDFDENGVIPSVSGNGGALMGRSPAVIAAEINMIKAQTASIIHTLGGHIRSGVYEIGRLLCEAKASVPHGEWGEWLETNVAYSDSTAQNLMRIYRELSDGQVDMLTGKTQAELFAGLDYSQVIEVLKLPKAERARLAEENDLEGMSSREIKALIKEKKALEERVAAQDEEILDLTQEKNRAEMAVIEEKGRADNAVKALEKADAEREKAVKAAEKTKCRIGAWLLEDGIEYPQSGGTQPYHNIHDQSLRIADSKVSATDWSGYALGTIEAGKTVEHVFTMDMNPSWNAEKCHVVVFATTPVGSGYYVNNIVDVLLNDSVQFEYIK